MNLTTRDACSIWHPFTQHSLSPEAIPIVRGEGAYLYDEEGKSYLDLISSWWVNLHGHAHPIIAEAIYKQALTLEHVVFSRLTHEPAIRLAEELLQVLPKEMNRIFYSDNGSTSIEVAIKMAFQFWKNQGIKKNRLIAFEKAYHGDTFGAMSVGRTSGFYSAFEEWMFEVDFIPYPETWLEDELVQEKEDEAIEKFADFLSKKGSEVAALLIEPLIQGAGGMRMCRPEFLKKLEMIAEKHHVLMIYDEVMTGFGRTGELFASIKANTSPDIICLSKGLTGGFLPLAVTACKEKIYEAFLGDNIDKALIHGHSYTAHPLGCAAALASLEILLRPETTKKIKMIESVHKEMLMNMYKKGHIHKPRYCGTISAFECKEKTEYGSVQSQLLRERFLKRGLLFRPLGDVMYLLPPYCITEDELRNAYQIIEEELVQCN